jgi:hypothetical protein
MEPVEDATVPVCEAKVPVIEASLPVKDWIVTEDPVMMVRAVPAELIDRVKLAWPTAEEA